MKKMILFLFLLVFMGCAEVGAPDINRAECFCKDKGGVHKIFATKFPFFYETVTCNNGEQKAIEDIIIDQNKGK